MSKRILCYGDSNTWGYNPDGDEALGYHDRFPYEIRYTGVLQGLLGSGYRIIEEGLNGRTTVWDDPMEPYRNGMKYIEACLDSHAPIDLVLIMLGSNDMKPRIIGRASDSAMGAEKLVKRIKQSGRGRGGCEPKILVISPIAIDKNVINTHFLEEFGESAVAESLLLLKYLKRMAEKNDCEFLDAAQYAGVGSDALHMTAEGHGSLANALAKKIGEII